MIRSMMLAGSGSFLVGLAWFGRPAPSLPSACEDVEHSCNPERAREAAGRPRTGREFGSSKAIPTAAELVADTAVNPDRVELDYAGLAELDLLCDAYRADVRAIEELMRALQLEAMDERIRTEQYEPVVSGEPIRSRPGDYFLASRDLPGEGLVAMRFSKHEMEEYEEWRGQGQRLREECVESVRGFFQRRVVR